MAGADSARSGRQRDFANPWNHKEIAAFAVGLDRRPPLLLSESKRGPGEKAEKNAKKAVSKFAHRSEHSAAPTRRPLAEAFHGAIPVFNPPQTIRASKRLKFIRRSGEAGEFFP